QKAFGRLGPPVPDDGDVRNAAMGSNKKLFQSSSGNGQILRSFLLDKYPRLSDLERKLEGYRDKYAWKTGLREELMLVGLWGVPANYHIHYQWRFGDPH